MKYINLITFTSCTIIVACSSPSTPYSRSYNSTTTTKTKSSLPKVPPRIMPGGDGDNWRYLGRSNNGTIGVEINNDSISSQDNNQYKFQDRKTIVNPSGYAYNGTPSYRYSLSWWSLNCSTRQYQITSTALYDNYGKPVTSYNFDQTQSSTASSGSIAEAQYNYVCNNIKKNVGY